MVYGEVYMLVHRPTGRFYVGVAKNVPRYDRYESPSMGRFILGHWDKAKSLATKERTKLYRYMHDTNKHGWDVGCLLLE